MHINRNIITNVYRYKYTDIRVQIHRHTDIHTYTYIDTNKYTNSSSQTDTIIKYIHINIYMYTETCTY